MPRASALNPDKRGLFCELPRSLHREIRLRAVDEDRPVVRVVIDALEAYLGHAPGDGSVAA